MYKEHKVLEMTTGDLAIAYQKVDRRIRKVAGGCWEWDGNNSTTAARHRLQFKIIRVEGGERETHAVKTIDLIRHKNGYRVDEGNRGYTTTCSNPNCFNPAHQISPKFVDAKPFSMEELEQCKTMRRLGWSTHYQRTYTTQSTYIAVLNDKSIYAISPTDLASKIDLHKVMLLATMFTIDVIPTIDDMISTTGLSFDELMYYGYAVSFIHRRMKSKKGGDTLQILKHMTEGKSNGDIAARVGRSVAEIHMFRGALYG